VTAPTLTPPWEATKGTDLADLPRDTIPRAPHGDCCEAKWSGEATSGEGPWKCTMPADHEPEPHRAGNGSEILAEWPSVEPLGGAPSLATFVVWDAEGRRWSADELENDLWHCDGAGREQSLPGEVLAEVFGPLRVEAESWW